ncbi:Gfo/Idh/MocA family oxidoreductase [Frigidibacter albus]|uniref:Gfo/Idh/MocA family oxidoreductase n=1 Tax=Frigidibacter albus TaxID=1465486 RepID=A0A6L8VME0_9RHOB|nr:Gfo/Idh/MocA family oxidoreductase [Frigidibacter albus]MZQ90549.1 Gfo/Idh/MocA family oxidoreductase [Frigidibacter albus]NBE32331.1 Gfo/Idh/MocA family oxidoreductase [Frigidibacter albus]GGH59209.1 oxidoreductase [Frigidibacter albus]
MTLPAIAVVGAGAIGRKHVAALAQSRMARLAAIVDPSPAAAALAAEHGVALVADLAELDGVAGVILATPTSLHLAQALYCIGRGWPVLVEKPVAATAAEGEQMAAAADAAGVPVLVGHHRRHNPRIAAARAALQSGAVGRVIAVQASVLLCKPDDYFAPDWRRQPGAGPILTNLIHEIDTMRHLLGEVVSVQAVTSSAVRGFAVEDSAVALLHFASGALATVTVSDAAAAPWSWELTAAENADYPPTGQSCLLISGTEGALELPNLRLWQHSGPRGWFTPLLPQDLAVADADPLIRQIDHFAAVIAGTEPPLVPAADAARSVAVVDAILRAAKTGHSETPYPGAAA